MHSSSAVQKRNPQGRNLGHRSVYAAIASTVWEASEVQMLRDDLLASFFWRGFCRIVSRRRFVLYFY